MKVIQFKINKVALFITIIVCINLMFYYNGGDTRIRPSKSKVDRQHSLKLINQLLGKAIHDEEQYKRFLSFNDLMSFESIMKYKAQGYILLRHRKEINQYFNCGAQSKKGACSLQFNEAFRSLLTQPTEVASVAAERTALINVCWFIH